MDAYALDSRLDGDCMAEDRRRIAGNIREHI